jgi:mannose-6-phosphate isomerase-like protein (cupin superfamily)
MKKLSPYPISILGIVFFLALAIGNFALAVQNREARVTQVIKDVRLLASGASPRPASLNDSVRTGTAVRTGRDSRTELTFTDRTLARLGANSIFTFTEGAKNFDLSGGAMLLSVPEQSGPAQVKVGAATAAISGFAAMFEHHARSWSKFIVLHGRGTISFKGISTGPCRLHAGQMVVWPPHPVRCPEVLNVDLSKVLQGKLIAGFSRPLPEIDLILAEIEDQKASPPPGGFSDPTNIETLDQNAAARPTATPIKQRTPGGR